MTTDNPAIMVAGTRSGSGKTTLTLGLMAALGKLGHAVQPFKCGPDFIDPGLHRLVTGRTSPNLDLWMCGEEFVKESFAGHSRGADISIIEGVMGMFDGGPSSTAALAGILGVPLLLVVDAGAAAESVAAVVKGFESLDPDLDLRAVVANRVGSPRHYELVAGAIKKHCRAELVGSLPRHLDFAIPSRHLGLVTGEESPISPASLDSLAAAVADHIDLGRLLAIAGGAQTHQGTKPPALPSTRVRIGVARDRAFSFYYGDNLDFLRRAGAELVFFSPLADEKLPKDISGVYLGGGYPELYAEPLCRNRPMRRAILAWAEAGRPLYAECGGFMYLTRTLVDEGGVSRAMAGIFPVTSRMRKKRFALGYREIRLREDCLMGRAGATLRGHEFHYSEIDPMPETIPRIYQIDKGKQEGYLYKNVLAGYLHLHFASSPDAAAAFVRACLKGNTRP